MRHHRDRFFAVRQVLNVAFMLLAIVGVVVYLTGPFHLGVAIIMIAVVVKMAESVMRTFNR